MDPFSITVGAVALLDTANKLSKTLMDRYQAFSAAPKKMCEIANDVTMVAGLVEVFATSVEGAGSGIKFPDKFQRDASNLVDQCFDVLTEIDTIIPSGSKKPDYSVRLRYAFGNEKKVQKHQEKLRQVQHMFMFMTTMWMYQLPAMQGKTPQVAPSRPQPDGPIGPRDPGLFASDVGEGPSAPSLSMGSWTGVMQQVPVTIGGSGGVNFEATLTLNPIRNLQPQIAAQYRSRTSERARKSKEVERKEKKTLENLRRSPYFSMSLFSQPRKVTAHSRSREDNVAYSRIEVGGRERIIPVVVNNRIYNYESEDEYKDEYEKERARMEKEAKMQMESAQRKSKEEDDDKELSRRVLSEGEAKMEVEDLISQWFNEAPPSSDYDAYYGSTKNAARPSPGPSSSGTRVVIVEHKSPTTSSTSGRRPSLSPSSISNRRPSQSPSSQSSQRPRSEDWYWRCDHCDKKFHNEERRYECQDCKNFDFCPSCYGSVWHQHPESSFRVRGEKERPRSTGTSRY